MSVKKTHVIVVGNEKGGSGKTTTSMHLIIGLLDLGFRVGTIDVDYRQQSLTRYLDNRRKTAQLKHIDLLFPYHTVVKASPLMRVDQAEADESARLFAAIQKSTQRDDFLVIDTPGSNTHLSRMAHSFADTMITPVNDSFVDLDVIAQVESDSLNIERPGIYSQMVWEQKLERAKRDRGAIDWIVLRNRLSTIDAKNKRNVEKALAKISKRLGCRIAEGFCERVIYRELFLHGLTLLDVVDEETDIALTLSHVAARQELRKFLTQLNIPKVTEALTKRQGEKSKGTRYSETKDHEEEQRQELLTEDA